jgi:acetoin utilization protein AcuB
VFINLIFLNIKGEMMTVKKIMTKTIVSIEMNDSLAVVKHIFDNSAFHHLLVIEAGLIAGVISDRDLLKALSPNIGKAAESVKDAATLNKKAHQIMSRNVISLLPNASIYHAISIFNQYNISCLPIVDIEGKPVGILSWRDIFKLLEVRRKLLPSSK